MKKLLFSFVLITVCLGYFHGLTSLNLKPFLRFVESTIIKTELATQAKLATVQTKLTESYHKRLSDLVWYLLGKAFTGLKPQLKIIQEKGHLVERAGTITKLFGIGLFTASSYSLISKFLQYRKKSTELDIKIKKLEAELEQTGAPLGGQPAEEPYQTILQKQTLENLKKQQSSQKSHLDKLATPILLLLVSAGFLWQGYGTEITGSWLWWLPEQFIKWRR